jgi:hypothetical protein
MMLDLRPRLPAGLALSNQGKPFADGENFFLSSCA